MSYIEEFRCQVCGYKTHEKYWGDGIISHGNLTSDHNMQVDINRGGVVEMFERVLEYRHHQKFLDGVFKHQRIWLSQTHPDLVFEFDKLIEQKSTYSFDPVI